VRSTAGAIVVVVAIVVLPQLLVTALPLSAASWVMRSTPAAGFSIQQTIPRFPQVTNVCLPEDGCYFDNPWSGFAVAGAYTVLGLLVAYWFLRRRDA
jgi:hypothetical protein